MDATVTPMGSALKTVEGLEVCVWADHALKLGTSPGTRLGRTEQVYALTNMRFASFGDVVRMLLPDVFLECRQELGSRFFWLPIFGQDKSLTAKRTFVE